MQYKNIPYKYNEWTTHAGKSASGYSCEAFDEFPYYIARLTSQTEDGIDHFLDHKAAYEARRELSNKAAQEFYNSMGQYKGD